MTGCASWTWPIGLGLNSSATMMFGHVETIEDRIEHLERLRAQQDKIQRVHRLHRLDLSGGAHQVAGAHRGRS